MSPPVDLYIPEWVDHFVGMGWPAGTTIVAVTTASMVVVDDVWGAVDVAIAGTSSFAAREVRIVDGEEVEDEVVIEVVTCAVLVGAASTDRENRMRVKSMPSPVRSIILGERECV